MENNTENMTEQELKERAKKERDEQLRRESNWRGTMCINADGSRSAYKGSFGYTLDNAWMR